MAARAGGFHYKFQGGRWIDTKNGSEFFLTLSRCATEQAGLSLTFES
jgi:CyaY protein